MSILKATVQDFVLAYDDIESVFLQDPDGSMLDDDLQNLALTEQNRLQLALDDADCMMLAYYVKCLPMGRAMLTQGYRRLQMRIARYLLDTVKARQSVKEDYKDALDFLNKLLEFTDNVQLTQEEADMLGVEVKQSRRIQFQANERVFTRDNLSNYREGRLFFN